jgi:hypothetical protein
MGYPRTLHLDGSGLGRTSSSRGSVAWKDLAGLHVVIEEKIDGSETSVEFDEDLNPIVRFRGNALDMGKRGGAERQFDALKDWAARNAGALFDRIDLRYRVFGEWAFAAHTIFYDALPDWFLEFDVEDKESGRFLDTPGRAALLGGLPVHSVPVLRACPADPSWHPSSLVTTSAFKSRDWTRSMDRACLAAGQPPGSLHGRVDPSDIAEGVYGKVEQGGEVVRRFKWVRKDFVERLVGGPHWNDLPLIPNLLADGGLDITPV